MNKKNRKRLEGEPPPVKEASQTSAANSFECKMHCLFCVEPCATVKDPKNPNSWKTAFLCRTSDRGLNQKSYKDYLLKVTTCDISVSLTL